MNRGPLRPLRIRTGLRDVVPFQTWMSLPESAYVYMMFLISPGRRRNGDVWGLSGLLCVMLQRGLNEEFWIWEMSMVDNKSGKVPIGL